MSILEDLKINRDLLDAKFDGYKLSLESFPLYSIKLSSNLDSPKFPNELYSYQHLKAFGVSNKLYRDSWTRRDEDEVYLVDEGFNLFRSTFDSKMLKLKEPQKLFTFPSSEIQKPRICSKLIFPHPHWLAFSNGFSHLILVYTGNRESDKTDQWKVLYNDQPFPEGGPFTVEASSFSQTQSSSSNIILNIVCLAVNKLEDLDSCHGNNKTSVNFTSSSLFSTQVHWITFKFEDEKINLIRRRVLQGEAVPELITFNKNKIIINNDNKKDTDENKTDNNNESIIIVSDKMFKFTFDSKIEIKNNEENKENEKKSQENLEVEKMDSEENYEYSWLEKKEDIIIIIKINNTINKNQVTCHISKNHLFLKINNHNNTINDAIINNDKNDLDDNSNNFNKPEVLIDYDLEGLVLPDSSTWIITDNNILEIHLEKMIKDENWNNLFKNENWKGKKVLDEEQMEIIKQVLKPLETKGDSDFTEPKSLFNNQQLEECDDVINDNEVILNFHGDQHHLIQQINISNHQWLFSDLTNEHYKENEKKEREGDLIEGGKRIICLRHDVDGLIFRLEDGKETSWQHVATFNALGYVQASKERKKFILASDLFRFAAIVENSRHVFIYKQPSPFTGGCLRNRTTNQKVSQVSKQHLITLETSDVIEGAVATYDKIFIVTKYHLYCTRIIF